MSKAKRNPRSNQNSDLQDSVRDQEKLENEETTINLPDVKDIPGQEYIHAPNPGEYADTTISSADEEGDDQLRKREPRLASRSRARRVRSHQ